MDDTFIGVVLILAIFLLLFWIRKQNQYIQTIKDISDGKSREIQECDKIISKLLDQQLRD